MKDSGANDRMAAWQGFDIGHYYMCGAEVKSEDSQGKGDETAANGLNVTYCLIENWNEQVKGNDGQGMVIQSGLTLGKLERNEGGMPNHYTDGAQVRFEDYVRNCDNTALNGLKIHCQSILDSLSTSWVTVCL